jgi:hypothetical protein
MGGERASGASLPSSDKTYIAFQSSAEVLQERRVSWTRFPAKETRTFHFCARDEWVVASPLYSLHVPEDVQVSRYTGKTLMEGTQLTKLTLFCLDSGREDGKIQLEHDERSEPCTNASSRAKATLVITGRTLTSVQQAGLCARFNELLERLRADSWSLILAPYYARKSIPVQVAYRIVGHLLG